MFPNQLNDPEPDDARDKKEQANKDGPLRHELDQLRDAYNRKQEQLIDAYEERIREQDKLIETYRKQALVVGAPVSGDQTGVKTKKRNSKSQRRRN